MDFEKVFSDYYMFLQTLLDTTEIEHVGGSSVKGAITKGDLDIQVRISATNLEQIIQKLDTRFERKRAELWNEHFAIYADQRSPLKVDIMVTVIGSPYDNFHRIRDVLQSNRDLLEEYNNLKVYHPNSSYDEYTENKKGFFGKILREYLDVQS